MEKELSSTPKLSLSKLPSKPRDQLLTDHHTLTPPLRTVVSIPFQWEVAPGKPKATISTTMITNPPPKNKAARCLDLPPRLLNATRVTNLPSPTRVLEGPSDHGRSLSSAQTTLSFSFRKDSSLLNGEKQRLSFGSWRWGSFKEGREIVNKDQYTSVNFSVSVNKDHASRNHTTVKITRIRRRGSFVNLFGSNSNPLVGIYESFKLVVPWRRRRKKDLEAGASFTSQEKQNQPPCVELYV